MKRWGFFYWDRFCLGQVIFGFIHIVHKMKEGESTAVCNVFKAMLSRKSILTKNWIGTNTLHVSIDPQELIVLIDRVAEYSHICR